MNHELDVTFIKWKQSLKISMLVIFLGTVASASVYLWFHYVEVFSSPPPPVSLDEVKSFQYSLKSAIPAIFVGLIFSIAFALFSKSKSKGLSSHYFAIYNFGGLFSLVLAFGTLFFINKLIAGLFLSQ